MDYIFTIHGTDKDYDIDLYDIVSCHAYPTYVKWKAMWLYDHAEIEVDGDYEYKRFILNEEQYNNLLDIARKNMDSFGFMFGKITNEYRY